MDLRNNRDKGLFDTDLAVEFGVEAATVIERFRVWVQFNQSQDRNYKNGRYWTFNSLEGLVREFPWLKNKDKAHRLMSKLEQNGVLLKGQHATDRNDRRTWYAFTDEYAKLLFLETSQKCEKASQNCEKDVSNVRNGHLKTAKCNVRDNPEITQTKKKENDSISPVSDEALSSPAELTSEQALWQAKADEYADPLPDDAKLVTMAMLEALPALPPQIAAKPLRMQLMAAGAVGVPAGLFVEWLVCVNSNPQYAMQQLDRTKACAAACGVTPVAVLLYSLEKYRDTSTPEKNRLPCFPRSSKPIADSQPSTRSKRAAKAAPTREHVA